MFTLPNRRNTAGRPPGPSHRQPASSRRPPWLFASVLFGGGVWWVTAVAGDAIGHRDVPTVVTAGALLVLWFWVFGSWLHRTATSQPLPPDRVTDIVPVEFLAEDGTRVAVYVLTNPLDHEAFGQVAVQLVGSNCAETDVEVIATFTRPEALWFARQLGELAAAVPEIDHFDPETVTQALRDAGFGQVDLAPQLHPDNPSLSGPLLRRHDGWAAIVQKTARHSSDLCAAGHHNRIADRLGVAAGRVRLEPVGPFELRLTITDREAGS